MSVVVKGMQMPINCPMCPMSHWNKSDEFTGCEVVPNKKFAMNNEEYRKSSTRPKWCPLEYVENEI